MKNRICIKFFTLVLLSATLLVSCADEEKGIVETQPSNEGKLTLKVSPTTRGDSENEIEKINSLRLILLDKDGKVKANILQTYQKSAEDFEETFEFDLVLGEYKVYAIVNEESIDSFELEKEDILFQDLTLKESLDSFIPGNSGIEDFLNNIYFAPDYTNAIPYSSCYNITVDKEQVDKAIYLVPVATKFQITFYNYRNDPVVINRISINEIADSNYLMASLSQEDSYMGEEYWIDWLQKVSAATNPSSSNNEFINDQWGWLRNYGMPENVEYKSIDLLKTKGQLEIPKGDFIPGTEPDPSETIMEPYYFPESKFIPSGKEEQQYTIEFEIQRNGEDPPILKKNLTDVKTLFRNTFVNITVEMNSSYEEIYVEITRWNEKSDPAYGTI